MSDHEQRANLERELERLHERHRAELARGAREIEELQASLQAKEAELRRRTRENAVLRKRAEAGRRPGQLTLGPRGRRLLRIARKAGQDPRWLAARVTELARSSRPGRLLRARRR